jgi:hypothetical protein
MRFSRQRSGRSSGTRRNQVSEPEALETRQVLSHALPSYLNPWLPSDLPISNPVTHQRELIGANSLYGPFNVNSPIMDNAGKIVSGTDRAGDKWVITVHGPGKVIVTDTTPNDGALDDDINTIQLVGTSLKDTYVTGQVVASATNFTEGDVLFNQLIDTSGVKSIILNGFVLTNSVSPPVESATGVFLYGGVQVLSFQDIEAQINTSVDNTPYQIVIGNASTPLKVEPSIYLNRIDNLVYDSTATTIPTGPLTSPTVQFIVNGVIHDFDVIAATRGLIPAGIVTPGTEGLVPPDGIQNVEPPTSTAAYEVIFPVVGTTGRTSVQATAINKVHVPGSAINVTFSRATQPFSSSLSGLKYLHEARFGGNADALGIDVNGTIGKLSFRKGLGNPSSVFTAKASADLGGGVTGQLLPATNYGVPEGSAGYPSVGLLGGLIRANKIKSLRVKAGNVQVTTPQNPQFVQLKLLGWPTYSVTPGDALTNAVITTAQSINSVHIVGTQLNTEIKTGFDYPSYVAGLEGTRARSAIKRLEQKGDLISSSDSATFRPADNQYQHSTGVHGPGVIRLKRSGLAYNTGGVTGLGNTGAGVFARHVKKLK